jgi:hypothetical protein
VAGRNRGGVERDTAAEVALPDKRLVQDGHGCFPPSLPPYTNSTGKRKPGALGTAAGQVGYREEGVLSALNRHHLNHKTIRMNTPPAGQGEQTLTDWKGQSFRASVMRFCENRSSLPPG